MADDAAPGSLEQGMSVLKNASESWFTELSSLWPGTGAPLPASGAFAGGSKSH